MTDDVLPDSCSLPPYDERARAVDAVRSDPDLTAPEKELTLRIGSDVEYATMTSEIPSTVRKLLAHGHFGIEWVRVSDAERFGQSLSFERWRIDEPPITGVKGYAPIGVLKIKESPRATNFPSSIVSDHAGSPNGGDAR